MARTTGRSGFKLKSGNNMKGSSFKMMGSSPAKRAEVYADGELVTEGHGKGKKAVEAGIKLENINDKKRNFNIKSNQEAYNKAIKEEDFATQNAIEEGNIEGGKKTTTVTYTGEESKERSLAARGMTSGGTGNVVTKRTDEKKYPTDYKMESFDTDEDYKTYVRQQNELE